MRLKRLKGSSFEYLLLIAGLSRIQIVGYHQVIKGFDKPEFREVISKGRSNSQIWNTEWIRQHLTKNKSEVSV